MPTQTRFDIPLDSAVTSFDDVYDCDDDGNRLLGTVRIFGTHFHVEMLRVERHIHPQFGLCLCGASGAADDQLANLMQFDSDGDFQTVQIPGREGEWVIAITPFTE